MTNLQRLKLEVKGLDYPDSELSIYLEENGLSDEATYDTSSQVDKRRIFLTALSCLESLANQPQIFKNYKTDDITVSDFAENLQNRIDQLERKVRMMAVNNADNSGHFFLFD